MTQMIQQNRLAGFRGECFFLQEAKDKMSWYQYIRLSDLKCDDGEGLMI
jgi:hypothetical protein